MDYENVWLNCDGSSPSTAQHSPSYFLDTFAPASTSYSFPKYYFHKPLDCPSCVNCAPHIPNDVNGNKRHHAFHQNYTHFRHTDGMQNKYFQQHPYNPKMKGRDYYGPTRYQQNMRMHPQGAGPNMKTNQMKQNTRRKRKYHSSQAKNKAINGFYDVKSAENNFTENSSSNVTDIPKWTPNDQSALANKEAIGTDILQILNECYTEGATLHYLTNECEFQTVANLNQPTSLNNPTPVITESSLNMESDLNLYSQEPNISNCKGEDANASGLNMSEVINTVTEGNSLLSTENAHMDEDLLTEAGNTISEVQIKEYLENAEAEHYALQTVFEGKDESGKDIIILMTAPEAVQNNIQQSSNNSIADKHCQETERKSEVTADNRMRTDQGMDNAQYEFFISSVDDFCHEEIVKTSNECSKENTNENKNAQNVNQCKIQATKDIHQRQAKKKRCLGGNATPEITDSENVQHQNVDADKVKKSHSTWIRNRCRNKVKINNNKLRWKMSLQHTPRDKMFRALSGRYIQQFMREFKSNNIVNDAVLEKMMKVILRRIGGNIMQSIYMTFQQLIKIYNSKSINDA